MSRCGTRISPQPRGILSITNNYAVAFSPDGKFIATVDDNGNVRLRDISTGHQIGVLIRIGTGAGGEADIVTFSPDSELLATNDDDGGIWLSGALPFTNPYIALCAEAGPPTAQQWAQYATGEPPARICKQNI